MAEIKDPENTILMETTKGKVVIELFPDLAPGHVDRIKELTREGAYDGVVFHRVIDGFMVQTGDVKFGKSTGSSFNPSRAGMGGSEKPDLKAEFSNVNHARHLLDGSLTESELGEFSVLHLLRRCRIPEPAVYGLGPGHRGHGQRRQDQAGRAGPGPRQDRIHEDRGRRSLTTPASLLSGDR